MTERHVTVAVVGGGPAGLMAAEVLAAAGAAVTVFDRMPSVGRKLLLAGRSGLNLTHSEPLETFLDRYGDARPVLEPAIAAFDPAALRDWSKGLGQETFVGTSGRVFPVAFRATSLLRAWLHRLGDLGVTFRPGMTWRGFDDDRLVFEDRGGNTEYVLPDATVLALGGGSWSKVGSDGAWVAPVAAAGVVVAPLRPANCGFLVDWSEPFARFAGAPLKDVVLTHGDATARGDVVVSAIGIEGGPVYALSAGLREAIEAAGTATMTVDLRPDLAAAALADRLARRRTRDSMASALRRVGGLPPVAVGLLREATANHVPTETARLAALVKAVPVGLTGTYPLARAISTAGGVELAEIDGSFMLKRRPGTFVAGEMLDWDAPTGGYLLQACFSTGVAAAGGVLRWLGSFDAGPDGAIA